MLYMYCLIVLYQPTESKRLSKGHTLRRGVRIQSQTDIIKDLFLKNQHITSYICFKKNTIILPYLQFHFRRFLFPIVNNGPKY